MVEEILLWLQKHKDLARSARSKTVYSKAVLEDIEANLSRSTRRVSGELGTSQSSEDRYILDLGKCIKSYRIVHHLLPKYCKTFDSS